MPPFLSPSLSVCVHLRLSRALSLCVCLPYGFSMVRVFNLLCLYLFLSFKPSLTLPFHFPLPHPTLLTLLTHSQTLPSHPLSKTASSLVAIATHVDDTFKEVALETLCELAVSNVRPPTHAHAYVSVLASASQPWQPPHAY